MSLPTVSPKGDYGSILLSPILKLFESQGRQLFGTIIAQGSDPLTFEALGLSHWLVLYETDIIHSPKDPAILYAKVRDRALVYVDDHLVGTLSRTSNIYHLSIEEPYGQKLKLLIENQGRLNYGNGLRDFKVSIFFFNKQQTVKVNYKLVSFIYIYLMEINIEKRKIR